MPHGLDHIVHAVRDLDAAAEFYGRAGFTVGSRNRHPWGTHNYIVQFAGVFIELLGVGEADLITAATPGTFSFASFSRDFLTRDQGLAMLVLEGRGAAADAEAFRAAGIGRVERQGRVFTRVRRRSQNARRRLLHLPATLSGELLESGIPAAPEWRFGHCRSHHGFRKAGGPCLLPRRVFRGS
jgi:catechol 2,3-dioxygenase-like lactoylglutathione lyase family enzyme